MLAKLQAALGQTPESGVLSRVMFATLAHYGHRGLARVDSLRLPMVVDTLLSRQMKTSKATQAR